MAFQDVQIVIDVNKPGALSDLGTPLLLVAHTTAGEFTVFANSEGVKEEFGENHSAYKMALVIENQGQYRPDRIAVATYSAETTSDVVLRDVFDKDWYFVMLDVGEIAEKKAISDVVEGKALKQVVHLVTSELEAQAFESLKYRHTFLLGVEPSTEDELANVAAVGANGSRTVGSITWKFKPLVGVTPITDRTLALAFEAANANYYMNVNGKPHLRNGVMVSGEFIDSIHGQDWIKVNGQTAVQTVLMNASKVPYGDDGVAQLVSALADILELAGRNGIIAQKDNGQFDYVINAIPVANLTAAERASRKYSGLSFEYREDGAIHEAKPIRGVVNF